MLAGMLHDAGAAVEAFFGADDDLRLQLVEKLVPIGDFVRQHVVGEEFGGELLIPGGGHCLVNGEGGVAVADQGDFARAVVGERYSNRRVADRFAVHDASHHLDGASDGRRPFPDCHHLSDGVTGDKDVRWRDRKPALRKPPPRSILGNETTEQPLLGIRPGCRRLPRLTLTRAQYEPGQHLLPDRARCRKPRRKIGARHSHAWILGITWRRAADRGTPGIEYEGLK